jgi:hypothetical protein
MHRHTLAHAADGLPDHYTNVLQIINFPREDLIYLEHMDAPSPPGGGEIPLLPLLPAPAP